MKKMKMFLSSVCDYIKYQTMHKDNQNELTNHINKQHITQTEWPLIGLTAFMVIIGCVTMFISSRWEYSKVDFFHYLFYAFFGIAIMTGVIFFDYIKLKKIAWFIYLFALVILIATFIGLITTGAWARGEPRVIQVGGFNISPEYTILLFIISFAGFIENTRDKGLSPF